MLCAEDCRYPFGLERFEYHVHELGGQPFLKLGPSGQHVKSASQLAQPRHLAVGHIANVGRPVEGQEVVFADLVEPDIFENDHLVVAFIKICCQFISRVLVQAGEELGIHPGDSLGGVLQSFAVGVFTNRANDRGNGLADLLFVDQLLFLPSVQAATSDVGAFCDSPRKLRCYRTTRATHYMRFCNIVGDLSTIVYLSSD